jgi:hypothetical protein
VVASGKLRSIISYRERRIANKAPARSTISVPTAKHPPAGAERRNTIIEHDALGIAGASRYAVCSALPSIARCGPRR